MSEEMVKIQTDVKYIKKGIDEIKGVIGEHTKDIIELKTWRASSRVALVIMGFVWTSVSGMFVWFMKDYMNTRDQHLQHQAEYEEIKKDVNICNENYSRVIDEYYDPIN